MSVLSKRLVSAICLILFVECQAILAQSVREPQETIRTAVESADWQTALAEITNLRSSDPNLFKARSYDYLLGRVSEKVGDVPTAIASYQAVVARSSALSAYALWRLAHIARSSGDLVLEREYLRRLMTAAPQSLLFDACVLRLAESFYESEDYRAAADSILPAITSKNVPLSREATALLGQTLLRSGKQVEARDVFTRLIMQMPDASRPDDFALTAVRELDALDKAMAQKPQLSEADHLLRASIYQFNRDFPGARSHYQAVIDLFPQSGTVPNATYQLGRGLYLEGKYEDAIKAFQLVRDQFPQTASARDAIGYLASSYVRLKQIDQAVAAYKLLIEKFPDAPNPERPYLNIIDALHESGRYSEALSWVQQTRLRFKSDLGGALALFGQMRIHLAQSAWPQVISDADELIKLPDLGGTRVPGGTTPAEVNFLRSFALEKLGRIDDAIAAYLSIPDGRNEYYGALATQRLLALANDNGKAAVAGRLKQLIETARTANSNGQAEQARLAAQAGLRLTSDPKIRGELLTNLRASYQSLPTYQFPVFRLVSLEQWVGSGQDSPASHQQTALMLASFGLYDEAMPELFAARVGSNGNTTLPPNDAYTIAVYSLRGGIANRAVRFGEQIWRNMPADYVLELAPRELVELLYPAPHRESLLNHATKRNVDPRFVLSIARQESRYQADAKSVAAARGMMQFIPATANEIAAQLNLHHFIQDELYDADTAILFGSQYLANLFQQFPSEPDAVAAAYNGGADNMARWKARSRSAEPERYVAEIGFSQTKDYVYRVMTNFWNYQHLYDAQFRAITQP